MHKFKLFKFIIPVLLLISGYAQATPSYNNVYIFGDSLSDTGNWATVIGDFPPPYFMNRVTNGSVAVDTLTAQLGHTAEASLHLIGQSAGTNYSVAGARAVNVEAIDLPTQILSFHAVNNFVAPSDALYVIFIGGNDVRFARDTADKDEAKAIIMAAANEVRLAIESLSQAGAKSFLVVNAPNVGIVPETQLIAAATSNPELIERATRMSKHYRKAIHKISDQLEDHHNIDITEFDLFEFFNKLVENANLYGFTNSTDACFSSVTFSFHPDCNFGASFDQFVFFDEIHPTARVHAIVGNAMAEAILEDEDDDEENDD